MLPGEPFAMQLERLTAFLAAVYAEVGDEADIRIFKNDITPTPSSVFADFVAGDYDGAAAITLTMSAITQAPGGQAVSYSQMLSFVPTGSTTPNTGFGVFVFKGTVLIAAQRFTVPVDFDGPLTGAHGVWRVSDPFALGWVDAEENV